MKKILRILFILIIMFKGGVVNCQNNIKTLKDAYYIEKVVNSIGVNVGNYQYNCISFQERDTAEVLPRFLIEETFEFNWRTAKYFIHNDSLNLILPALSTFRYKIVKKDDRELILVSGENTYYFKRILKITENTLYFVNDTFRLTTTPKAHILENLPEYFLKKLPDELYKDTSSLVNVEFILTKDLSIDSLKTDSDSITTNIIKEILLSNLNNWDNENYEHKKFDCKVSFSVFIKSKEQSKLKARKTTDLIRMLINLGNKEYNNSNYREAERYFSDCEKIFDSYLSLFYYSLHNEMADYGIIKDIGVNSIMNLAIVYFQEGQKEKACNKWRKASVYDNEAIDNYNMNCAK